MTKQQQEYVKQIKENIGLYFDDSALAYSALMAIRGKSVNEYAFGRYIDESKARLKNKPTERNLDGDIAKINRRNDFSRIETLHMIGKRFLKSTVTAMLNEKIYDTAERSIAIGFDKELDKDDARQTKK